MSEKFFCRHRRTEGRAIKKREVSEETSRSIDCAFARSGRAPQGRSFGKNRAERHAHAAHAHLHSVHEHVRSHGDLPKKPKSASCFVRGNIRSDRLIFSHYSIPHFPLSRKIPPETEIFLLDFALFSESRTFLSKANVLSLRHVVTPPLTSSFRTIFSQKMVRESAERLNGETTAYARSAAPLYRASLFVPMGQSSLPFLLGTPRRVRAKIP